MESVCSIIRNKWSDIRNIAIFHRLGQVLIKEESIVIAISSPHRKESLEAVNFCIDEVKKMVPIWKKVVFLFFITKPILTYFSQGMV